MFNLYFYKGERVSLPRMLSESQFLSNLPLAYPISMLNLEVAAAIPEDEISEMVKHKLAQEAPG